MCLQNKPFCIHFRKIFFQNHFNIITFRLYETILQRFSFNVVDDCIFNNTDMTNEEIGHESKHVLSVEFIVSKNGRVASLIREIRFFSAFSEKAVLYDTLLFHIAIDSNENWKPRVCTDAMFSNSFACIRLAFIQSRSTKRQFAAQMIWLIISVAPCRASSLISIILSKSLINKYRSRRIEAAGVSDWCKTNWWLVHV